MKFTTTLKEDCVGEYKIYRYKIENIIDKTLTENFATFGEYKLYENFPKPYFSIKSADIIIKGILGENELEVTFFEHNESDLKSTFESKLS